METPDRKFRDLALAYAWDEGSSLCPAGLSCPVYFILVGWLFQLWNVPSMVPYLPLLERLLIMPLTILDLSRMLLSLRVLSFFFSYDFHYHRCHYRYEHGSK